MANFPFSGELELFNILGELKVYGTFEVLVLKEDWR